MSGSQAGPIVAYKLFTLRKDKSLGPLFIDKKLRIPIGEWMIAESHLTKGFSFRPGFHTLLQMEAPHLKMMDNRVWAKVEIEEYEFFHRSEAYGGKWALANRMRVLEVYP